MSESEGNTSVDQLIKTAPVDSSVFHDEMLTLNQVNFNPPFFVYVLIQALV